MTFCDVKSGRWLLPGMLVLVLALCCGAASAQTNFSLERETAAVYTPGAEVECVLRFTLSTAGSPTFLGLEETLPPGWTLSQVVSNPTSAVEFEVVCFQWGWIKSLHYI